jgi:SAM-dependent methyltransferase
LQSLSCGISYFIDIRSRYSAVILSEMNWLNKIQNHSSWNWLQKMFQESPYDLSSPFFCARNIDEVHEYFRGYNTAEDPHLLSEGLLPGYCFICKEKVLFEVDRPSDGGLVNWRETLKCPHCRLINRWRSCLHLFEAVCKPAELDRIYITEALSPIFERLSGLYANLSSSEFLPDAELGEVVQFHENPINNQDVTQLTFDTRSFDAVLSFDVLEHVPDYRSAIKEFYRVLDTGGHLILTVPFIFKQETQVRAVVNGAGEVEHLMQACYHGDPLSDTGVLAYYDFGMELLDQFREVGFKKCFLVCFKSNHLGYPSENVAFVARR